MENVSMTPLQVAGLIYNRVCGSCDDPFMVIDMMIEEGDLNRDFFKTNEIPILSELDNMMFTCEVCGWNYDISEHSSNGMCYSCEDDQYDD